MVRSRLKTRAIDVKKVEKQLKSLGLRSKSKSNIIGVK